MEKLMTKRSPFELIGCAQQRADRVNLTKHHVRMLFIGRDQPGARRFQRSMNRLHRPLRRRQIPANQHVNVIGISPPVHRRLPLV